MGTTRRLSSASFAPAAEDPVEAPTLGALRPGDGDTDGDGEPDGLEGDGEGDDSFVGLGDPAPPPLDGAGAGAPPPPPPSPDGSTGDAPPSGDVSGTLARRSSGSARSRSGASYENSPLANPAAAITPAAAVPASATISPVRRRRRPRERPADGTEDGEEGEGKWVGGAAEVAGPAAAGECHGFDPPGAVVPVATGIAVVAAVAVVIGIAVVGVRSGFGPEASWSSPSST
ncbi:hypothetical protein [Streptomyces caniscabiei]|uniref:hypothetical protein n=1 Tax=Streptomyces caniscabiei TaxID=2746961 RepID=UPI0038F78DD5